MRIRPSYNGNTVSHNIRQSIRRALVDDAAYLLAS